MILFTLVESDALEDEVLRTDAEWYLAHSTFYLAIILLPAISLLHH